MEFSVARAGFPADAAVAQRFRQPPKLPGRFSRFTACKEPQTAVRCKTIYAHLMEFRFIARQLEIPQADSAAARDPCPPR